MVSFKEFQDPDKTLLSEYLPWSFLSAPGVVENKDGSLQKTFSFCGPDLDSATKKELIGLSGAFNNALRGFGDQWTFFIEAQKNPVDYYPKAVWPNKACFLIDNEREANFKIKGRYFENEYFLTIVKRPPSKVEEKSKKWFITYEQKRVLDSQCLKEFLEQVLELSDLLKSIFPIFRELSDDETLTYLHSTVSGKRHPVKTPDIPMYLDHILSDEDIEHGLGLRLGKNYVETLTINSFPSESFPGILDNIYDLGFSFRWMSRYICMGQDKGKNHLSALKRMWYAGRKRLMTILQEVATQNESGLGETSALNRSEDADAAIQLLSDGLVNVGFLTATVTLFDESHELAVEKIQKVASTINQMGFTCKVEKLNALDSWLSTVPGNVYANVRRPIVHSLNFSHMTPLSSIWSGDNGNTHLKSHPHFIAKCRKHTPFRFSSNVGDVGHTLVFGPTGAGKSTLLSFMSAQWLKYDDAQVFFFDKGKSSRALTECIGGTFFNVGSKIDGPCFQPLRNIDVEHERIWANEWLTEIIRMQGCKITTEIKSEIWQSLIQLSEMDNVSRTISVYISLVQIQEIRDSLAPYSLQGPYGYLFDAIECSDEGCEWQVFEISELFDQQQALVPALLYLFHRLSKRFNGRPTLLILDEAWLFLENSIFSQKIKHWLKELRKANVYVVFATQSLSDAMQSSIAMSLKESCPTKIFLPNPSATDSSSAKFYEEMGLNERQIEIIAKAISKREYYTTSSKGNRLFDLTLGSVSLALCASSSAADQKLIDSIKKNFSEEDFLANFLKAKGVLK